MRRGSGNAVALTGALFAASCFVSIPEGEDDPGAGGAAGDASLGGQAGQDASAGQGGQAGQPDASSGGAAGTDAGGAAGTDSGSGGTGAVASIPGLLGHWPFDEGAGATAKDITAAARHGVLPPSGVAWSTDAVFGKSLEFSTPPGGVVAAAWWNAAFPTVGTVLLWIKSNVPSNTTGRGVFDGWDDKRQHLFLRTAPQSSSVTLQCAFQPASNSYVFGKDVPITNGQWMLVGAAWDVASKTVYCYANGLKFAGAVQGTWTTAEQQFEIGDGFVGLIDDVRLYDHMLTDSELALVAASGSG